LRYISVLIKHAFIRSPLNFDENKNNSLSYNIANKCDSSS